MATPEQLQQSGVQEYKQLIKRGGLRKLTHGDFSLNDWTDLYEILDQSVPCPNGGSQPAKFLLYEHDDDNKESVTMFCVEDAPKSYIDLLGSRTAA